MPHEHNLHALLRQLFRFIWIEDDLPLRCAGTRGQTRRQHNRFGVWINCWVQQLIKLFGRDALDGCGAINQTFMHHVNGDAHGGRARAFACARLKHPEPAALDGELHVLHVAVMLFEQLRDRVELLIDFRQLGLQLADLVRCAYACDHVLALRV